MIQCPYIQRWQPEDTLTISYPMLRWTYMEVRKTKKTFLIFLISSYVNLGARFLYTIQTLEYEFLNSVCFFRELDLALH